MIEIGCGSTGIPGLVSMACGASDVLFCDLDSEALSELSTNINLNLPLIARTRELIGGVESPQQPSFSFYDGDWKDLHHHLSSSHSSSLPSLILASEIVYDAIMIEPLVECLDRLMSEQSASLIFCQSRQGRGNIENFFGLMSSEPYNYHFEPIHLESEERYPPPPPSAAADDFIFGIFHK